MNLPNSNENYQTINLTNCDREPIHIPGAIQPHGVLLVLEASTMNIIQVSNNTKELIDRQPEDLLNKPLSDLLDLKQINSIKECLTGDFENINPLQISIECQKKHLQFDGIIHQSDRAILLELESKTSNSENDFFNFYKKIKVALGKIQIAATLEEMCQVVVEEIRKITGFDRVMIYQLHPEEAGKVIAEDKLDSEISYLNLQYPSTDIPQQARQLYTLNWLRLIPNADYQPATLIPLNNPLTGRALDLSLSVLRSVSPIHLEYMHNMGVTASMSISLIQDRKLWGLIACHHSSPKHVSFNIRTACEFIGQVMSLELVNKLANRDLDYKMRLKSLQTSFVESLSRSSNLLDGLIEIEPSLPSLVSANGAVVCLGDRTRTIGQTPPQAALAPLLDWLKPHLQHNTYHTECLSKIYPKAEEFKAIASGLLALEISKINSSYILWFRPEVLQTINWGGDPNKPAQLRSDGTMRLSPRKSFQLWQERVSGHSLPWKSCEIEAILELRSLIVGIVLRQADALASMNLELKRSNEELDSFAYIASHDLKEPLRGIHNYANFLMEDYGEILEEDGTSKLQTLVRLTQRMEDLLNSLLHFSRLGRSETIRKKVNLNELVQQAIATLTIARPQNSVEFRIPRPLPIVECDRAQINELFTNLISNSIKYNDKDRKWVEIGFLETEDRETFSLSSRPITFYVRDNGIGISQEYFEQIFQIFRRLHGRDEFGGGTGAGLTIARKIVERHGGKMWVESQLDRGSTFYFTLAGEAID
jgi:two-component system, chemotaxis family, sensor kinase Cph1